MLVLAVMVHRDKYAQMVPRAGAPPQAGGLRAQELQAARRLWELQEPGSRGEVPLEGESRHTP